MSRRPTILLASALAAGLALGACAEGSTGGSERSTPASTEPTLVTAPREARVDLARPTFSNPTEITNPLFPITELTQVLQLGEEAGAALRFEVTLLPETKVVEWKGERVETVVSQFVGYSDGQILEVAVDFFAQADDGSVWYFGEDVDNYKKGVLDNHEGTWLAGKDGPPGMIMPADPQVGDVYRPENVPGFVFEEVTVKSVGETVAGPTGPVDGAIIIQELLMDGLLEDKTFTPGYGEFHFAVPEEKELVDLALAVPTDARSGPVPAELSAVSTGVEAIVSAASSEDWSTADATLATVTEAWAAYQEGDVPELLAAEMEATIAALADAVGSQDAAATRQAAIPASHASLDLQLQYRAPADVDGDRLGLWEAQLALDSESADKVAVRSDRVIIETIQARLP